MRLIDRYVFTEWLKTFALAMTALLSILIVEDIQDDLSDYIQWGATTGEILYYYVLILPSFFPVVIPLSLFVSLLFMLGNLHRNNEIVAMRAHGMHLFTITRSLWAGGLLLSLALLYLNGDWVPRSVEITRTMRDNWKFSMQEKKAEDGSQVGLVYALGFHNQQERRLWFMNRYSRYGQRRNEGFGINVYVDDELGREVYRVMAKDGYYDETVGHWFMNDGREIFFDPEQGGAYRAPTFGHKAFPEFTEEPVLMLTLAKQVEDLSLFEIRSLLKRISPAENPKMHAYEVRYQTILALPFTCLVVVGIAIPFAVSGVRTNPMIGVSKAVGLLVAYYVLLNLLRLLGEQQVVSPWLAAWLPIVLMLGVAVYFFRRRF